MIKSFIITTLSLLLITYILPGFVIDKWPYAILAAVIIGLINVTIKPILKLLTFPITLVTLGLFSWVINALMLMLADALTPGFQITTFWVALLAALLLSFISTMLKTLVEE
ncbi:MAG: phage holin family protein [bacterium]|nr:phage holin family protein [bacterium]